MGNIGGAAYQVSVKAARLRSVLDGTRRERDSKNLEPDDFRKAIRRIR